MAGIFKQRAHIIKLAFVAVLWCALVACTGPLVYRPVQKPAAAAAAEPDDALPMPDPKLNDATLAGVDTTGIGIRDDVHIWIYQNYTAVVKRTIVMTMAKAIQDVMVTPPTTTEEAKSLEQSYKDAAMMLRAVRGLTQSQAAEMDRLLFLETIDTPERMEAYLRYNLLLEQGRGAH
ncbi:hypothetical protein [Geobacter sp. AOG2]|uniref:hypothetical protein n=1 Tax=Geobacter sp. AOG2 TaxID=1566347 RepID=UPI001CC5CEEF|nr:hypothetical protein [Geobacter sp. AOG2]GFE62647.1 hypothetical protein AOG2_32350 [Geobacter sp. AOG2]